MKSAGVGAAMSNAQHRVDMEFIKNGSNSRLLQLIIPQDRKFIKACDELEFWFGMNCLAPWRELVMNWQPIPKKNMLRNHQSKLAIIRSIIIWSSGQ